MTTTSILEILNSLGFTLSAEVGADDTLHVRIKSKSRLLSEKLLREQFTEKLTLLNIMNKHAFIYGELGRITQIDYVSARGITVQCNGMNYDVVLPWERILEVVGLFEVDRAFIRGVRSKCVNDIFTHGTISEREAYEAGQAEMEAYERVTKYIFQPE